MAVALSPAYPKDAGASVHHLRLGLVGTDAAQDCGKNRPSPAKAPPSGRPTHHPAPDRGDISSRDRLSMMVGPTPFKAGGPSNLLTQIGSSAAAARRAGMLPTRP